MSPARRIRVGPARPTRVVERLDGRPLLSGLGAILPIPTPPADLASFASLTVLDPGAVPADLDLPNLLPAVEDQPIGVALDLGGIEIGESRDDDGQFTLGIEADLGWITSIPPTLLGSIDSEDSLPALVTPVDEVTELIDLPPLTPIFDLPNALIGEDSAAPLPPGEPGVVLEIPEVVEAPPIFIEVATEVVPASPEPAIEAEVRGGTAVGAVEPIPDTPPVPTTTPTPAGPTPIPLRVDLVGSAIDEVAHTALGSGDGVLAAGAAASANSASVGSPTVVPQAPTLPGRIDLGPTTRPASRPAVDAPVARVAIPLPGPTRDSSPVEAIAEALPVAATGPASPGGLAARGAIAPPAPARTEVGRVAGNSSAAIRRMTAAPTVDSPDSAGDPGLARDLRDLLGQFRSLAVGLHDRLAAGDPTSWILLAAIASVGIEVARRELGRGEGSTPAEDDPDLLATWGLS